MKFSLNIDHVAFLRNARGEKQPDPVTFALMAEQFGVDGIVVHLREDRRHIKDADLYNLRSVLTTKLDLEMAADDEIIEIARDVVPDLATLVPEKREELTTEGGLDVVKNFEHMKTTNTRLHEKNIPVSLFIEPNREQIYASKESGADIIEIHTGTYANAPDEEAVRDELNKIADAAKYAKSLGLGVNAGHGLNYLNIRKFIKIRDIDEISVGQSVVAKSVFLGLETALKELLDIINYNK